MLITRPIRLPAEESAGVESAFCLVCSQIDARQGKLQDALDLAMKAQKLGYLTNAVKS